MIKLTIYNQNGQKTEEKIGLPETIFEAKINQPLMAQAVKVFLANQRTASPQAKTRAQVEGSNKKIWSQKGTGRARHGDRKAPIFVGGGKAHGPVGYQKRLAMSQNMKQAALRSALSLKAREKAVFVVTNLEKIDPKTKQAAGLVSSLGLADQKSALFLSQTNDNIKRAFANLSRVKVAGVDRLNVYQVLLADSIILTKEAVNSLKKRLNNEA
jgi:large subunit ribosomal protein L4